LHFKHFHDKEGKPMGKILLAIDGITPSRKVFQYALQLCKWMKAEMDILQIISPPNYRNHFTKAQKRADSARRYFQSVFAAAAFAEAGEHETAEEMLSEAKKNIRRLLPESEKAGIQYRLTCKTGDPEKEITNYVEAHRNIALAIYDQGPEASGKADASAPKAHHLSLFKKLKIPVVFIHR
jgi:tetratricopeptide (TPR) repeat protein